MRFHSNRIILGIFFLICGNASWASSQEPATVTVEFAGKYVGLRPEQKHLVDDWFNRFGEAIKKPVKPEEGYDLLPLSLKTTFNAVTHALMQTRLTNASGASLGDSAVTLIDKLDNVVGKVPGAGGDKQFRMYAQLKPGALDILAKSKEFKRGPNNTVYHKGYPVCYRSTGGTPSIQFSTTKDGSRADVDVDYRSSKFPVFLINGHLTASNSDVRAGKNDQLHNRQWTGMQNWWRNLLGLPLVEKGSGAATDVVIAQEPRVKKNAKPAEAIHDFLKLWLVEQKPNEALGYFAEQSSACMELERGEKVDHGMAKVAVLVEMQELNRQLGKLSSLSEAVAGVRLTGPRAKMIEQPYGGQFVLYDVREDLAEQFNCVNRLDTSQASSKAARSKTFGKYVGAVFRLKSKVQTGETVATLWQKEKDYWKMISYEIEPEFDKLRVPNTTPAAVAAAPALALVAGDPQLVQATKDFLEKWLLRKQVDEAFQYLSPRSYSCVNLYRDEETPEPKSPEEAGQLTRRGMERMASAVAHARKLEDAIMAPELNDPDIKLVKHSAQKAYVIASIPDYMATIADCANRKPGEEPDFRVSDGARNYGSYYGVGFKLAKTVGDPGVLWTAWNKESGAWKILSYVVITP